MRIKRFSFIFSAVSLIWLLIFGIYFIEYSRVNKELSSIEENIRNLENIKFYEKNIYALDIEYENAGRQSFSSKSTSEFVAKLPKLSELSRISQMRIETIGVKIENSLEVTEMKIITTSQFPDVANFIDILERSKLPIQIADLQMNFINNKLNTEMVINIYKKIIED